MDPRDQNGWCFPDNESGILAALKAGATHLWANTILFASHSLQTSVKLNEYQDSTYIIGQPPSFVEKFDDKEYVNDMLRATEAFNMPQGWSISKNMDLESFVARTALTYPVVAKPVRGRGSFGVKLCHSAEELRGHVEFLFKNSPRVMIEEYLLGEEATVTVMPPSASLGKSDYWALPIVTRFNHENGIAPYNGLVAVTQNSKAITPDEYASDDTYTIAATECEAVARHLQVTAPIRVDIRRFKNTAKSPFALFDVNMKPVSHLMLLSDC